MINFEKDLTNCTYYSASREIAKLDGIGTKSIQLVHMQEMLNLQPDFNSFTYTHWVEFDPREFTMWHSCIHFFMYSDNHPSRQSGSCLSRERSGSSTR